MSKRRFIERQGQVHGAAARLSEALVQSDSDILRDAMLQRFKCAFAVIWKTLRLYLEHQGHECSGPRPTLKRAFAAGLIATPEEADVWMAMLEERELIIHAYNASVAARIYRNIVKDYAPLLAAMADRIQKLTWD